MDNDNPFASEQLSPQQQRTLKELGRMSLDRIRVYNPTNEDYFVRWDSLNFLVPASSRDIGYGLGQAIHPRYVAVKFAREMTDKILGEKRVDAVKNENARRIAAGLQPMNKWEEEPAYADKFNVNDLEQRTYWLQRIWLGVESKYGMDTPEQLDEQPRRDPRNIDEDILAKLERPAQQYVPPTTSTPTQSQPVADVVTPTESKENLFQQIEG